MIIVVKAGRQTQIEFEGYCVADVAALNHDDSLRRIFRLYRSADCYVAERIDNPGTIDVRYWGTRCQDVSAVYDFFGNEPLANYLYGVTGLTVPGLRKLETGVGSQLNAPG